jgi:hypothetical protein
MRRTASALALGCVLACTPSEPSITIGDTDNMTIGEQRTVELRYLRFDVTNFEKRLNKSDILALPHDVRDRLWLLDLDLSSGPNTPQLLDNALTAIRALDPATLSPAARNMQALLSMTPDSANLKGTSIEQLIDLAPLMGVAPEQVLADLFHIDVEDTFLSDPVLAHAILEQVIRSHPNAQTRLGPKTTDNPSGVYEVTDGALPIMLTDVVSDFETFGERFGPYAANGVTHPGFVAGKTKSSVITKDFALTVHANANALPYKGVDLTDASAASVSSVRSQIQTLFDFDDPNWLQVDGLVEGVPSIESLTFRIVEDKSFVKGGFSPEPRGMGASLAWTLPEYTLERVLISAAQAAFSKLDSQVSYTPPGHDTAIFSASVADGWQDIVVQGGIGSPPRASYVWDLLLEVAEVRLHDGGIKEGDANVEFSLSNIPLGTDTATLQERIRENLRAAPEGLIGIAQQIIDNTAGAADFYYYRASTGNAGELEGDWLFFIAATDIENDDDGKPVRDYGYRHPGFFADAALTRKISQKTALDGDLEHEKIRLSDHPSVYAEDDEGAVFELSLNDKPSPNHISLDVKRVH